MLPSLALPAWALSWPQDPPGAAWKGGTGSGDCCR